MVQLVSRLEAEARAGNLSVAHELVPSLVNPASGLLSSSNDEEYLGDADTLGTSQYWGDDPNNKNIWVDRRREEQKW